MSRKYTPEEFYEKCDYEGGIEEAIFGYGLSEKDLAVREGEFFEAVKELAALGPRVRELSDIIYELGCGE